jgi:type I restriction enzyme M protein
VEPSQLNWIANFIWGIADDVLRDLYVRGKYRDVILPMTVLRRLDAVLEPTKLAVLDMKRTLDAAGIVHQDPALRQAAGQAFYNTSKFTLRDLRNRASRQQLRADFEAYLDGFSPNLQDILDNFEFRNQIPRLSKADALGTLIEKFLSPDIHLSPSPICHNDGSIKQPGLDNHGMGTIFEELVRRFNEENNEEAGEHWTPRDAVNLMAKLIFLPVADTLESGTYLLYDGALWERGGGEGRSSVVEYEPDADLRGTEQVALLEDGGIEAFLRREVLPYAPDARYVADNIRIGYEISFTRYFYKPGAGGSLP